MTKGRRAADRRREREKDRGDADPLENEFDVSPSDETQFGSAEVTTSGPPPRADSLTRAANVLDVSDDGEQTVVREQKLKPKPLGIRLQSVDGSRIIDITSTPFVIGRTSTCDLVLDASIVSRQHAQIVNVDDGGFLIEDIGSTSGTGVNGVVIDGPQTITHGDFVRVGDEEFRVRFFNHAPEVKDIEVPGGTVVTQSALKTKIPLPPPPKKKDASTSSRAPLFAALGAAAIIVVGAGVGIGAGVFSNGGGTAMHDEIDALLKEARALFQERRFQDARARVDTIFAIEPGHRETESLLRMIESEEDAKRALDDATTALSDGRNDDARASLQKIPDSSLFKKDRDALLAKIARAEKKVLLDEISALIDAGRTDDALAQIDVLLERWPGDVELLAMKARVTSLRGRKPKEPASLTKARQAFAVGNREQARIIASSDGGRGNALSSSFVTDVDAFEKVYASGKAALAKKNAGPAGRDLESAYALARRLSGSASGVTRREVGAALADALFLAASADENSGRACDAAEKYLRAYSLDGEDRKITDKKRALEKKARAGLERAKAKRTTNRAAARDIALESLCFALRGSDTAKELNEIARAP